MFGLIQDALIVFLVAHVLADWHFQSLVGRGWMARNKSKNIWALFAHVFSYSCIVSAAMLLYLQATSNLTNDQIVSNVGWFILLNGGSHLIIDAITSQGTSYCYVRSQKSSNENDKNLWNSLFFSVIGTDLLLHLIIAVVTINLVV